MVAKTGQTDVTKADALRLKRNYGYAHKQFRDKPFDDYRKAMNAALLHLGNDHSDCDGSWCKYKAGTLRKVDNKRSLLRERKRYKNLLQVHQTYTTDDMLKMSYHPFDSQKNEAFNAKVAVVAPKTKTFCKTMSLNDRISLVIIEDSVGYDATYTRIIAKLTGRTTCRLSPALRVWLQVKDKLLHREKHHRTKPATKKKRASKIQEKIKAAIDDDQKARKRGLDYGTGIAVAERKDDHATVSTLTTPSPAAMPKETMPKEMMLDTVPTTASAKRNILVCGRCGEQGHTRVTSKKCKYNSE